MKKYIYLLLLLISSVLYAQHPYTVKDIPQENNNEFFDSQIRSLRTAIKNMNTEVSSKLNLQKPKYMAEDIELLPYHNLSSINVQNGIEELEDEKLARVGRNSNYSNTMSGGIDFTTSVSSFVSAYDNNYIFWNVKVSSSFNSSTLSVLELQRSTYTLVTATSTIDAYTLTGSHYYMVGASSVSIDEFTTNVINKQCYNTAHVSTEQKKFGTASLKLDGFLDWVSYDDWDSWAFGTNNFTFDMWIYFSTDTKRYNSIWVHTSDSFNRITIDYRLDTKKMNLYMVNNNIAEADYDFKFTIPPYTWTHVALERNGNSMNAYLNGTSTATVDCTGFNWPNYTGLPYLGYYPYGNENGTYSFMGYIDEFRISASTARYGGSFSVPTEEYGSSSSYQTLSYSSKHIAENVPTTHNSIFDNSSGYTGIGITNPTQKLEVNGNIYTNAQIYGSSFTYTVNPYILPNSTSTYSLDSNKLDSQHGTYYAVYNDVQLSTYSISIGTAVLRVDLNAEISSRTILTGHLASTQTWTGGNYFATSSTISYSVNSGTAVFSNNSDKLDGHDWSEIITSTQTSSDYAVNAGTSVFSNNSDLLDGHSWSEVITSTQTNTDYATTAGTSAFSANSDLLDGHSWEDVPAGGGDVYLASTQTFTGENYFQAGTTMACSVIRDMDYGVASWIQTNAELDTISQVFYDGGALPIVEIGDNIDGISISDKSTYNIKLLTNGNASFLGNVGIGTTSPGNNLEIYRTASAGNETLFRARVSDSGEDKFMWTNGTALAGSYVPQFSGIVVSTNSRYSLGFVGLVNASSDTANHASDYGIIDFNTLRTDLNITPLGGNLTKIQNKKLFTWRSGVSDADWTEWKMTMLANGNLGIGTTNPSTLLDVNGTSTFRGNAVFNEDSSATSDFRVEGDGDAYTLFVDANPTGTYANVGNVGIGTSAPEGKLHIWDTTSGQYTKFIIGTPGASGTDQSAIQILTKGTASTPLGNGSSKGWGFFARGDAFATTASQNDMILYSANGTTYSDRVTFDFGGNVGIGTTNPSSILDIACSNVVPANAVRGNLTVYATNAQAANIGACITLGGYNDDGASAYRTWASVEGRKETTASGTSTGYLSLKTNSGGTLEERIRINSSGNVGIGTTNPTSALQVAGNITPEATGTRTLGTSALHWETIYVSSVYMMTPDFITTSKATEWLLGVSTSPKIGTSTKLDKTTFGNAYRPKGQDLITEEKVYCDSKTKTSYVIKEEYETKISTYLVDTKTETTIDEQGKETENIIEEPLQEITTKYYYIQPKVYPSEEGIELGQTVINNTMAMKAMLERLKQSENDLQSLYNEFRLYQEKHP